MNVIEFEHVWKTYNLRRGRSVKSLVTDLLTKKALKGSLFYALQDVSFSVKSGSLVGIIGQNGAGKSTILKLLAGITIPTKGYLTTTGRIGALINLGAGFHPELTGRENIYLYGSIMGLKRKEIEKKFDEIIHFAGLEQFIDVPVKRYSSGMYVRLGFSTAMHIDPDILLVDEVLAVGDLQFQKKSLEKIRAFICKEKGGIFVSHNLNMVQSLCNRVIWLGQGKIRDDGEPRAVISHYITEMNQRALHDNSMLPKTMIRQGTGDVRVLRVELLNEHDVITNVFETGGTLKVRFTYQTNTPVISPEFRVSVHATEYLMPLFGGTTAFEGRNSKYLEGEGRVECIFPSLPLRRSTTYYVSIHIYSHDGLIAYDRWDQAREFTIKRTQPSQQDMRLLGQEGFLAVPFTYKHFQKDKGNL